MQHMTDVTKVNQRLQEHQRRGVHYPRFFGVGAAVALSGELLRMMGRHLPPADRLLEQQQQQQGGTTVIDTWSLPVGMKQMLLYFSCGEKYSHVLSLCATVLVSEGLLLMHLVRFEQLGRSERPRQQQQQEQEQEQQRQTQTEAEGAAAAEATAAGTDGAAAASSLSSTAVMSPESSATVTSPSSSSSSSSLTAAESAASCSSSKRNTPAAAALAAEQVLLLSASRLQQEAPAWLSAIPGWSVLLQGAWQDMGYPKRQGVMRHWRACGLAPRACPPKAQPIHSSGSGSHASRDASSSSSSVVSQDAEALLHQQYVNQCVDRMMTALRVLLFPLLLTDDWRPVETLDCLWGNELATQHVLHLLVTLLAVAQAAVELQAVRGQELVAAAAETARHVYSKCGLHWLSGEQLQQLRQSKHLLQQQQEQQQQQLVSDVALSEREGSWRLTGLVLLLRQLLHQAGLLQQQQQQQRPLTLQQQQQQHASASAASSVGSAAMVPNTGAFLSTATQKCIELVTALQGGDCDDPMPLRRVECVRMLDVLQVTEAAVRCLARMQSTATTPSSSPSSNSSSSSSTSAGVAAAAAAPPPPPPPPPCPDTPTLAIVQMCARVLTDLQCSMKIARPARSTRKARQQQQQLLQQGVLIAHAALSLLVTATKLPQALQSAEVCDSMATCLTCLQCIADQCTGAKGPQQQRQQQQQRPVSLRSSLQQQLQQQPTCGAPLSDAAGQGAVTASQCQQLRSAPQQELQRAVLVLAGRYLQLCARQAQQLVAAHDRDAAQALAMLVLGPNPVALVPGAAAAAVAAEHEHGPLGRVIELLLQHGPQELHEPGYSSSIMSKVPDYLNTLASWQQPAGREAGALQLLYQSLQGPLAGPFSVLNTLLPMLLGIEIQLKAWYTAHSQYMSVAGGAEGEIKRLEGELEALQAQGGRLSTKDRLKQKVLLAQLQPQRKARSDCQAKIAGSMDYCFLAAAGSFAKILEHAGALLCSLLPTRFCCNNPRCSSMATASEGFLLVRRQSCVCGGCLMGSRRPALAPTFCTAAT
jgi:hypothetical protein